MMKTSRQERPDTHLAPAGFDSELADFEQRHARLDRRKVKIVRSQITMEAAHPQAVPMTVWTPEEFLARAQALLAAPPADDVPLPQSLSRLLEERALLDRALTLAMDEGRRVHAEAVVRLRRTMQPEWDALVRNYALTVAAAVRLEKQRDAMFAKIGFGPYGRMPLPMSETNLRTGRSAISEFFRAAVAGGVITEKESE